MDDLTQRDCRAILAKRGVNGGDYWSTSDGRWGVGSPFSTFHGGLMLSELGLKRNDPVAKGIAGVLFKVWVEDGRIRPGPKLPVQPCHTANAARVLCRLGYAKDPRLRQTFETLLEEQHTDGGWRCNVLKWGAGADTDASNPGVTLAVLDAFRFTDDYDGDRRLKKAVDTLLDHWLVRRPLGPCRFGIGSQFMQVEYPFFRYNLFFYVYVLSFYARARRSEAFRAACEILRSKVVDGAVVIEHKWRGLDHLAFCRQSQPSRLATKRYREILRRVRP